MQLKYFVLLSVTLLLSQTAIYAQPSNTNNQPPQIDTRLYAAFDSTYLNQLKIDNPFLISYYNFYLDNGYEIIEISNNKQTTYPEVIINNVNDFNIWQIQQQQSLKRDYEQPTYYKIKNENKLLMLYAEKTFAQKLNQHLGRTY